MKAIFTVFFVALFLTPTFAQEFDSFNLEDEAFGTITSLTSTDINITSAGFRGHSGDYNGRYAVVVNDLYFFTASSSTSGDELWVTDGTREGTEMVLDINPGEDNSSPSNFVAVGNNLYFVATTPTSGTELWVSDGTAAGTSQVSDLFGGVDSSNPNTLTPFNGGLLFAAIDDNSVDYGDKVPRQQMWFLEIATGILNRLSANNINGVVPKTGGMDAHEGLSHFQLIGDTLAIFGGTSDRVVDGETLGQEIWVTNGTPEPWGTKMLVDINSADDNTNIQWLYTANEKQVIFRARTDGKWNGQPELTTLDNEYWVTDGTPKGTYLLQDFNTAPGSEPNTTSNTGSAFPINYGGKIVYRASQGLGTELAIMNSLSGSGNDLEVLWDVAPIRDGTQPSSFPDDFIVFDDRLFFKANFATATDDYPRVGQELGAYDIATDERLLVAEIFVGSTTNSFPRNKTIVNGRMYMTANDGSNETGYDIWVVDVKGDGNDPVVSEEADRSVLPDDYIVFKLFNDVDGLVDGDLVKRRAQSDLRNLNGKLLFVTKNNTLAIYDDGLEKTNEPYTTDSDTGLPVEIGENEYLDAPPLVALTSPASGSTFVEGDNIQLSVLAIDPENEGVVKVEYYQGDFYNTWQLLGTATSADNGFTLDWDAIPADDPQTITALAYDANDSSFSMPIEILVTGNTPPSVNLTLPNDAQEVIAGSVIQIAADASDDNSEGFVRVEFFVNDDLVLSDEEAPYGLEWTTPETIGTLEIKAVATDNLEASTTSDSRTITLIEEPLNAVVSLDKLNIYPVPATEGVINISNNFGEKLNLSVIDLSGKSVLEATLGLGVETISVDSFQSGIYAIHISRPSTGEKFVYKVIIE